MKKGWKEAFEVGYIEPTTCDEINELTGWLAPGRVLEWTASQT